MPEFDTDSNLVQDYKYGFFTDIETDTIPKGLSEEVIAMISAKKKEPVWMLEWRLKAYRRWQKMKSPTWAYLDYPEIDFQDIHYYSAPKQAVDSTELDPELQKTFERLGIPLNERDALSGVAMDVVFDSVSVGTTHQEMLEEKGIIFCSISEAIQDHPELVKKYLGKVVPPGDNYYAALNSAVFTDGSFCFIPKGVKCPVELSTYFRINAADTGQFERTLIVCEEGASCSYLEGCTAPQRDTNQLHAAVVEIVALDDAEVKYSTVQNWYAGDTEGKGGIYNFVTKRGHCRGRNSKISWTQVEVGSAITWKYPSVIMEGDNSTGEFYSVAFTNNKMQADTGTKMIHVGNNTSSTIVSKGISAGQSSNNYRGLVQVMEGAKNAKNHSACDSLLIGRECSANTFPYIESADDSATLAHEATTSNISEDQLFYLQSRGISEEDAASMVVKGFCKDVFKHLPLEFSVEAVKLLEIKLEGSIG
jgi:Fe-S cluster assembly protein SufB